MFFDPKHFELRVGSILLHNVGGQKKSIQTNIKLASTT
jgi:hypothetical protein